MDEYLALNTQLYDSLIEFDLYDVAISKEIPVYYSSGTHDYVCPVVSIEDYIHANGDMVRYIHWRIADIMFSILSPMSSVN